MRLIDRDALFLRINSSKIDESTIESLKHAIYSCNAGLSCHYKDDRPRPTNCSNCGAPLHSGRCEYCGTEY